MSFPCPFRHSRVPFVIPAKAGIHLCYQSWTLAFARVTRGDVIPASLSVILAPLSVIPAEAGIHLYYQSWTLAFARVTRGRGEGDKRESVIPASLLSFPRKRESISYLRKGNVILNFSLRELSQSEKNLMKIRN